MASRQRDELQAPAVPGVALAGLALNSLDRGQQFVGELEPHEQILHQRNIAMSPVVVSLGRCAAIVSPDGGAGAAAARQ